MAQRRPTSGDPPGRVRIGVVASLAAVGLLAGGIVGYTLIRPDNDDVRAAVRTIVPNDASILDTFTSGSDLDPLRPPFTAIIEFTDDQPTPKEFVASIEATARQAGWTLRSKEPTPAGTSLKLERQGLEGSVSVHDTYPLQLEFGSGGVKGAGSLPESGLLGVAWVGRDRVYARTATVGGALAGAALLPVAGMLVAARRRDSIGRDR